MHSRSSVRVASASVEMLRDVTALAWRLRLHDTGGRAETGQPDIVRRP